MELTKIGLRWLVYAIFIFPISMEEIDRRRPEVVLAEILTRPFVPRDSASLECIRDSEFYLKALDTYTPWAIQMYDASAKIPSGVITGNYRQLGNFDECIQVKSDHKFIGQACYAQIQFQITADNETACYRNLDLGDLLANVAIASNATKWTSGKSVNYEWMWCVPSTCNSAEIQEALEIAMEPLKIEGRVQIKIRVHREFCHTAEFNRRGTWDCYCYCFVATIVLVALMCIIGTGYDIMKKYQITSRSNIVLTSFSLPRNLKNLFSTERRQGSIACIDGIRSLSTFYIIFGHSFYIIVTSDQMNLSEIPHMHIHWMSMLILNANIVTDIFILMSGFLLSFTELLKKNLAGNQWNFNVIRFYVHRFIRLTPPYAMMIFFYATVFSKIGTGPRWDFLVGSNEDNCRANWWTNLLYINNFVNVPNMCMSQSWYLSLDMQLTWLSPLILYPMLKLSEFIFLGIGITLLIISILVPFCITYYYNLTGTMLYYKESIDVTNVYLKIYINIYTRFGPYIIGVFLTYILCKMRKSSLQRLTRWQIIILWLMAIILASLSIFWPRNMYFDTHTRNKWEASIYAGLHRHFFVSAIAWIIFCCENGYAGPIKHLLCWRGWIPLSKLSYCLYLMHYVFMIYDAGTIRTVGYLTTLTVIQKFFSHIVCTLGASVIWTICFEMPFLSIDRALFTGHKQKRRSTTTNKPNVDFMESGQEISQSNKKVSDESSITCDDNTEQSNINHINIHDISCESEEYIDCLQTIEEIHENVIEDVIENVNENVNEQTKKSPSKICIIDSDELDITHSRVDADNVKRPRYCF